MIGGDIDAYGRQRATMPLAIIVTLYRVSQRHVGGTPSIPLITSQWIKYTVLISPACYKEEEYVDATTATGADYARFTAAIIAPPSAQPRLIRLRLSPSPRRRIACLRLA